LSPEGAIAITGKQPDFSSLSPLRGSQPITGRTQGSQSLTLGLTLIAAPQLASAALRPRVYWLATLL